MFSAHKTLVTCLFCIKLTVIPFAESSESPYPNYNTDPMPANYSGMEKVAPQIAGEIQAGWNLGNTLEATWWEGATPNPLTGETIWGNPIVNKELIQLVKQSGFQAVRLPCSWDQYSNQNTAEIDPVWLDRVEEVVQYCIGADLYVLLNVHWDGGWLERNVTPEKQAANNHKQRAFWEQIATRLRPFDERLLFASANEPHVENAQQMAVLDAYHQTFVDAVRATGGRNAYRVLVVQGPITDIERTEELMNTLPTDTVPDRLMVEVHYYTPYNFALMTEDQSWGKQFYYWGENYHSATDLTRNANWGEETVLDDFFGRMKSKFVDEGIPVLLGEFAAIRRSTLTGGYLELHLASRAYYHDYLTEKANELGLLPFYWDTGTLGNHGSGVFDRDTNTVFDTQLLEALTQIESESYWEAVGDLYSTTANPDGDWADTFMERFLGSDPTDKSSIPDQPTFTLDAQAHLVYTVHRFSKNTGQFQFEHSHDLITWEPLEVTLAVDSDKLVKYVSIIPLFKSGKRFIRPRLVL
ncbi:glycoside hydrolase family 5 protein [Pelagicoccus sp. SDUM812002]|uniref:glycoside hydrolase family 5 protein n=1 Tax=Pelagicoccus sp. SDUM812002 TaxID=3041266 RepID=UPI00280D698D|nr:glycoside hydrolase family 5 protein [Pelagicoccus sp. SDUM812002]MDQ8188052.1 glycoside hydrolase family 5 protein [Pelagicoccus sp. SDUM812002]